MQESLKCLRAVARFAVLAAALSFFSQPASASSSCMETCFDEYWERSNQCVLENEYCLMSCGWDPEQACYWGCWYSTYDCQGYNQWLRAACESAC